VALARKVSIFLASPGDVADEREAVAAVVDELNQTLGTTSGLVIELVSWETHAWPGFGEDAQDVINQQVGPYDIFVGLMWKRLGTPTQRASSGTVEEFEAAYERWVTHKSPHLMFYFSQVPFLPSLDEAEEFQAVLRFRASLEGRGGFVAEYDSVDDLSRKLRGHLFRQLASTDTPEHLEPTPPLTSGVFAVPSHAHAVRRDSALSDLGSASGESSLIAVEGLSGSGKTFLIADYLRVAGLAGTTLWHDVTAGSGLDELLSLLSSELAFTGSSNLLKSKELMHHLELRDRRLVIDGYHLGDQASFQPLLEVASHSDGPARLFVLSRERVYLPPAASPSARVAIKGLERDEIAAMLVARGFGDSAERWVSGLQEKAGGLPLAVTLFASAVTESGRDPAELLAGPAVDIDARLRDWLQELLGGLPHQSRLLLRFLSVAFGPFNRGVVRMACHTLDLTSSDDAFESLQRAYLVQGQTPYRWSVHQLIAEFSRAELDAAELSSIHAAYGSHFLRLGQEWRGQPLDDETFALRVMAVRHLQEAGQREEVQDLLGRLAKTAKAHGHYESFIRLCARELADPERDGWIDYHYAHCCVIVGRLSDAFRAVRAAPPTTDPNLRLSLARLQAELLLLLGDNRRALDLVTAALVDADRRVRPSVRAQLMGLEARLRLAVGEPDVAAEIAGRFLAAAHHRTDDRGAAVAYTYLGLADLAREDAARARGNFAAAVERFRSVDDRRGLAWALTGLAESKLQLEDRDGAIKDALVALRFKAELAECSFEYLGFLERFAAAFLLTGNKGLVQEEIVRVKGTLDEERRKALSTYVPTKP
jgi:tetratricopeptide (TPR) repeat protein